MAITMIQMFCSNTSVVFEGLTEEHSSEDLFQFYCGVTTHRQTVYFYLFRSTYEKYVRTSHSIEIDRCSIQVSGLLLQGR